VPARAEWRGLLSVELVVGPDVAFGQQVGDKDGSDTVIFADDDLEGGKVVEKDLTAPAARMNNPPVAVATATIAPSAQARMIRHLRVHACGVDRRRTHPSSAARSSSDGINSAFGARYVPQAKHIYLNRIPNSEL
jgi:hypothetical protein